jgi:hypothetical protein
MVSYLQKEFEKTHLKYIIRMPINRKVKKMNLWSGRRFMDGMEDKSQISSLTPQYVTFEVVVAYDKHKDFTYLFATNLQYKSETILQMYRDRWGAGIQDVRRVPDKDDIKEIRTW